MNFSFRIKGRTINAKVRKIRSAYSFGLMFRGRNTENLLFEFDKDSRRAITSLFVFFPFFVIWLDKNDNLLGYRLISPFWLSVRPKIKYRKFVELPVNRANLSILRFFVDKRKSLNIR